MAKVIEIRRATPLDAGKIVQLLFQVQADNGHVPTIKPNEMQLMLETLKVIGTAPVFVATLSRRVIGSIGFSHDGQPAWFLLRHQFLRHGTAENLVECSKANPALVTKLKEQRGFLKPGETHV
jgi:hypothetical protein